jgi:hypothetical protein
MKNKLKKDFKFLRTITARTIISILIAVLVSFTTAGFTRIREEEVGAIMLIVPIISFIGLYFFTTWLYSDED